MPPSSDYDYCRRGEEQRKWADLFSTCFFAKLGREIVTCNPNFTFYVTITDIIKALVSAQQVTEFMKAVTARADRLEE